MRMESKAKAHDEVLNHKQECLHPKVGQNNEDKEPSGASVMMNRFSGGWSPNG